MNSNYKIKYIELLLKLFNEFNSSRMINFIDMLITIGKNKEINCAQDFFKFEKNTFYYYK